MDRADRDGRIVLQEAGVEKRIPHQFDRVRDIAGPSSTMDEIIALIRVMIECQMINTDIIL